MTLGTAGHLEAMPLIPHTPQSPTATATRTPAPIRQRWIACSFLMLGVASWAGLVYAVKDIDVRFDMHTAPRASDPIHYTGLVVCVTFSWVCVMVGLSGVFLSFRQRSKRLITSTLYLLFGCLLWLPGAIVTVAYLFWKF